MFLDNLLKLNFLVNITDSISLSSAIICLLVSTVLGSMFALFYFFTKKEVGYDRSFLSSIILLPIIVAVIIMLVSNDIVKAFSLGGVFVLVRFRTRIKDARDATFLFASIGVGFACGLDYYLFACLITVFILIVLTILHLFKLDEPKKNVYRLKIQLPENLDYIGLFDNVFKKYLKKVKLLRAKLTDFGSLIELNYMIEIIDDNKQKEFMDELRKLNGNLNILIANDYEKLVETTY